jgi:stage II sporulation protein E
MDFGGRERAAALSARAAGADRRFLLAARCGLYLLMGAVMAAARVLRTGAPFGMAMVACSGPGLSGVFALTGAALGYLVTGGLEWGIRYIAASVLVYTIAFVLHEL